MVVTGKISEEKYKLNAAALIEEIGWFSKVLDTRMKLHFGEGCDFKSIYEIKPPVYEKDSSVFATFIHFYDLSFQERIILMLAVVPYIHPQLLDAFFYKHEGDRGKTEFGGVKGSAHSGFLPTCETAMFILAGNNLAARFKVLQYFDVRHVFKTHNIIHLAPAPSNEPFPAGQIVINEEYIDLFTLGTMRKPQFSVDFPARNITSPMNWEDLVLDSHTLRQLEEIKQWLLFGDRLMEEWEMDKILKPGFRVLFHGAPGTGKTLTAILLGKLSGRDVYMIDLSMVVSKYIGETEKNLEKVFARAEHKDWILFFDEADALFGKRTGISDAHDKYANQEIAYLLQRLEDYNGLVILSSNMRNNIDEAFTRRLQSVVHFPIPREDERARLWKQSFSRHSELAKDVDLQSIASGYQLSGGSICNVVHYASLQAISRNEKIIKLKYILDGIKKEYQKEGKTI
jgi:hypothetical protein